MRISALPPGKIGLLGFGVEGKATLAALRRAGRADDVAVYSDAPLALEPGLDLRVGPTARLDDLALLLRSPGFAPHHPLRRRADAEGIVQSTATRLFLAEVRALGLPIIGVTGSKGKSTTSTLTALTLQAAGQEAALVGNIGTPASATTCSPVRAPTSPCCSTSSPSTWTGMAGSRPTLPPSFASPPPKAPAGACATTTGSRTTSSTPAFPARPKR
jgi:UDP-N-acetylmuramoylalanine-D-glutamate ligase